jgi:hypothetical protein
MIHITITTYNLYLFKFQLISKPNIIKCSNKIACVQKMNLKFINNNNSHGGFINKSIINYSLIIIIV